MIIDFHTHILPNIDDGSKSIEMSLGMLDKCGADICVATPHFYGNKQKLSSYLTDRERALEKLIASKKEKPLVALGAEVAYFPGISRSEGLDSLCIRGTRLFMLELTYAPWESNVLQEVEKLSGKYTLILAHLERFMDFRENLSLIKELQQLPVYVQINAESRMKFFKAAQIKRHIEKGYLFGSDMHNLSNRPPNLIAGRAKLSGEELAEMDALGEKLLKGAFLV